jgi:predicted phage tail protein
MKVEMRFHKSLLKYTNEVREITFDVGTYSQLISALEVTFPKLKTVIKQIQNKQITANFSIVDLVNNRILTFQDYFSKKIKSAKLCLLPIIAGSKSSLETALIAAAIITIAVTTGGAGLFATGGTIVAGGTATTLGAYVVGVGISMMVGAVMMEIMKPPKSDGSGDAAARQNDAFGPLQHTLNPGTPIPLVYGRHRVAGHLLSGEVRTLDKGPERSTEYIMKRTFGNLFPGLNWR